MQFKMTIRNIGFSISSSVVGKQGTQGFITNLKWFENRQ